MVEVKSKPRPFELRSILSLSKCQVAFVIGLRCGANPVFWMEADRLEPGARKESDESCGPPFRSAFPEVLKATTELGTAESDDGVGAANGPMHAGAFETCADGHLASGLHNAGGRAQAFGVQLRVAHMVSVGLEIVKAATCFLRARDLATDGVEQSLEFSGVEFFLPTFCPLRRAWMSEAVESFSEITQVLIC